MNARQALDVLRELDDPNAYAAGAGDVERHLAEARSRADIHPTSEVELDLDRPPRGRRRLIAALVTAAVLVAGTVSVAAVVIDHHQATPGAGAGTATSGSETDSPPVVQVTTTERVFSDQRDSLEPLNPADLATMDIVDVIAAVRAADTDAGSFLADPTVLRIREGLYTNTDLLDAAGKPTVDVPVFVISGGQSTCESSGKYTGSTGVPPTPRPCTAVIVVDAVTAKLLIIGEQSHH